MIAAGLRHARRFKEASLPALWEIGRAKAASKDAIDERAGRHAMRVLWEVYSAAPEKDALRKRLEETGHKELAAQLVAWSRK